MDNPIFENNVKDEAADSSLPEPREPFEILEYMQGGEVIPYKPDPYEKTTSDNEEKKTEERFLLKLTGRILALFFCAISLFIHCSAAVSIAEKINTKDLERIFISEVLGYSFLLSDAEESIEDTKEDTADNSIADVTEPSESGELPESYPIEKADLSVSEKNAFSLNNQTYFSVKASELMEKGHSVPDLDSIYGEYGKSAPAVLIIHTHGTEAYSENTESYTSESPFRSDDISKNVVAVGDVMEKVFLDAGINVIHDRTLYDKSSYRDSYNRSRAAVAEHLEKNPSITYIFDVHRDAIIREDKTAICPVGTYNGKEVAQVMTVVGTDQDGADHKDWRLNLALALSVQKELVSDAPGIARSINLRTSAFNQGLSRGYLLLEIGSCTNTLTQAKRGAVISAVALTKVIKNETHSTAIEVLMEKYAK